MDLGVEGSTYEFTPISASAETDTFLENGVTAVHIPDTTFLKESWIYLTFMGPIFVSQVLQRYCTILGPVTTMGSYGPVHLAGASLANTTLNILMVPPTLGIAAAMDTLSNQAGSPIPGRFGRDLNMLYTLRVGFVAALCMIPGLVLLWHFEGIFMLLGIEPEAAHIAAGYMRTISWGQPALLAYECLRKYAQARGFVRGPAMAAVASAPLAVLIMHSQIFGHATPPAAHAFYCISCLAGGIFWAYFHLPTATWQDLPTFKVITQDLGIVIRLGIAGMLSVCSDWFAWEYLNFASAWLGTEVLAANSVFLSSAAFIYSLPSGLRNGAATRVGSHLSRNSPRNAKVAAITAVIVCIVCAFITGLVLVLNSKTWVLLFTNDPDVTAIVNQIMPYFCVIVALDAIQGGGAGILSGAGLPIKIARAMLVGHWAIGLPLATLFAFTSMQGGLLGLWLGFAIGLILVCAYEMWTILTSDWESLARKAQAHLSASDFRAAELSGDT